MKQSLSSALLITILVSGLILILVMNFGVVQASTEVTGIIGSDTTWTKAGSPYSLTGNLLVGNGATLTIEAGVVVNLNGYYLMVNGTLRAHGTETEQIQFNGNKITFTQHSSNWDEQTGSGSIIDNANLESTYVEIDAVSPKISNSYILNFTVGGSPIISHNTILGGIDVDLYAMSPTFSYNSISGNVDCFSLGSTVFSFNNISGDVQVSVGSHSFINNTISGQLYLLSGPNVIANNTISGGLRIRGGSPIVVNNAIDCGLNRGETLLESGVTAAVISHNYFVGEVNLRSRQGVSTLSYNDIVGKVNIANGTINILGNSISGELDLIPAGQDSFIEVTIENNTITEGKYGIFIDTAASWPLNHKYTLASICGNRISGCSIAAIDVSGTTVQEGSPELRNVANIEGNFILNNTVGITGALNDPIRNNLIAYNEYGIVGGKLVEMNTIVNNTCGISGGEEIRNNTIANNVVGVEGNFVSFIYNNIYNNSAYNFRFTSSSAGNATYNWWGTTDNQAINQTIYDYKNDFTLGYVTFVPFLTEANSEAASTIPEFSSWLLLPLFLVATFAIVAIRKRLVC